MVSNEHTKSPPQGTAAAICRQRCTETIDGVVYRPKPQASGSSKAQQGRAGGGGDDTKGPAPIRKADLEHAGKLLQQSVGKSLTGIQWGWPVFGGAAAAGRARAVPFPLRHP